MGAKQVPEQMVAAPAVPAPQDDDRKLVAEGRAHAAVLRTAAKITESVFPGDAT
jgi:hypothetical protein